MINKIYRNDSNIKSNHFSSKNVNLLTIWIALCSFKLLVFKLSHPQNSFVYCSGNAPPEIRTRRRNWNYVIVSITHFYGLCRDTNHILASTVRDNRYADDLKWCLNHTWLSYVQYVPKSMLAVSSYLDC